MKNTEIFRSKKELQRLRTQRELLSPVERPVLSELYAGRSGLRILDVGCNDGTKTAAWFSDPAVSRVIGLEYNIYLAEEANSLCSDERFSFHACNVDTENFPDRLHEIMVRDKVSAFDIIYLSFLLSHLKDPERLLRRLLRVLAPGGKLLIVEADDKQSELAPDGDDLLQAFLRHLSTDPYAGRRGFAHRLPELLEDCGVRDLKQHCTALAAGPGEQKKKRQLFTMFLSYLPDDIAILREEEPENPQYLQAEAWLKEHYAALQESILREGSAVKMGMTVLSCGPCDTNER